MGWSDHPFGSIEADAPLSAVKSIIVLHPQRAPASMEHHRVPGLDVTLSDVLFLQRCLDVGCGDLLTGASAGEQGLRNGEAERLSSGKVDDEFKCFWYLDW
jgi:hypothetical protein